MSLAECRDIFGLSDESDDSSSRRSRSLEIDRGVRLGHFNDDDGDAVMRHEQDARTGYGVGTSIETMQEVGDRGILYVSPDKKTWLPPQRV